jgi:hypothetical protein
MQQQPQTRRTSGAKAIALDSRVILTRYRLLQLLGFLLAGGLAIVLHLIFGH